MPDRLLVCVLTAVVTAGCAAEAGPEVSGVCTFTEDTSDGRTGAAQRPADGQAPTSGTPVVTFTTNKGPLRIELDPATGPCSVQSLRNLLKWNYYDGSDCHRVTTAPKFALLQCGDPTGTGSGHPGYRFTDKLPERGAYQRGVVAMANAGPGTNGSQFFIMS